MLRPRPRGQKLALAWMVVVSALASGTLWSSAVCFVLHFCLLLEKNLGSACGTMQVGSFAKRLAVAKKLEISKKDCQLIEKVHHSEQKIVSL